MSRPGCVALAALLLAACGGAPEQVAIRSGNIGIEFNRTMHSRVAAVFDGKEIPLGDYAPSEFITVDGADVADFALAGEKREKVNDELGAGRRWTIWGTGPSLKKTVTVTAYEEFPRTAAFEVEYENTGRAALKLGGWTNHHYSIDARRDAQAPAFWSFQSGSYESRPDWVLPLKSGFRQENYLGMNATDYGGGTPVVDVWRGDAGIGVGHLELAPKLVSLPVAMPDDNRATVAVSFQREGKLEPGQTLRTFRSFVAVHRGDYFTTLADYRRMMMRRGIEIQPAPDDAFAPIWCAWGYGRDFKASQLYGALPVVKRLGFRWVTLDDGWQTAEGDWFLNPKKFPGGDRDIKAMVDRIHQDGFKAQLWWAPLAVDPGTKLIAGSPDQLLLNADGSRQKISWWDAFYLCPADPRVVEYHRELVVKIMRDWGFDGLKLDGQHMNGVPPCYNPAHKHAAPEESVEALPKFFQAIYETARSVKPDALLEFCPCGTAYSFFMLPFMNMSVASDPTSSWQVRTKGKTLKALAGDGMAYFGDHVEMSDGGDDFASTVGVGGVVGTNFVWPAGSAGKPDKLDLTPAKEQAWAKWVNLYREKMLSRGEYLGALYDIGFDRPEAHAIRKGEAMYYAFFAPEWNGKIQLRGLGKGTYRVTDYAEGKDLGTVEGPAGSLEARFEKFLLLEATPRQ
ncbi:MAG: alpha-galactosidase [Bryobacteraceae bacterium]|nr:alpha-galactosidase [Bryobacteraceae bacterium]